MSNFDCIICGAEFETGEHLMRHQIKIHPATRKPTKKQVDQKVKGYLERASKVLTGTFKSVEIRDKASPEFVNHLIEIAKMIQLEEK